MTELTKIAITGQHYIDGQWIGDANDFASFDPQANQPLAWMFANASTTDIDLAAQAAAQAFTQYRRTTAEQRAEFLETIALEIEAEIEAITLVANAESGLPMPRLQGETGRTCGQLRLFANNLRNPLHHGIIDTANPDRTPLPKPDTRLSVLPLGPVAVFGASNFPLAFSTAGGDTASALAAGCPVIVKGHPAHAATSELVTRAIAKAISTCNMPKGVFSLVQGRTAEVSTQLVTHKVIQAVGFTGSLKVGRILADACAARQQPIPFYGELGSTNPQFLLSDILTEQAETLAQNQVASMMMGHGQFCTSPGVVVAVKSDALTRYLAAMAESLADQAANAMLTPGIAAVYHEQVQALIDNPKVSLIAQGRSSEAAHQTRPSAVKVQAAAYLEEPQLQQEIFGPCAIVVECQNIEEMLQVANALEGQLTATIHGIEQELNQHADLIDSVSYRVGRIIFNQMPTGVEVCHSMMHGGPYPASTDVRTTSVGSEAISRFQRPICYQNMPQSILPAELKDDHPKVNKF
ncbi:aldehyde dehydrogenase (NADP(+)) [Shewanella waksmanii]|uniref:aldehyde dehydrogenase (NADP(+)) n=1 Tax=Shewanella waksmanii TaxID=213783 RepID=UPI0037354B4A